MRVILLLSLILGTVLTRAQQNTVEPQPPVPRLKLMKSRYDPTAIDLLFSMPSKDEKVKKFAILKDDGPVPVAKTSNSWLKQTGLSVCTLSSWKVAPFLDDKDEKYGPKSKPEMYRVPGSTDAVIKAFVPNLREPTAISNMAIAQIGGDQTGVCPTHEYRCVFKVKNEVDKVEKFQSSDCRTAYNYISGLAKSTDYKWQLYIVDSATGLVIENPVKASFKTIEYTKTEVLKDVTISADGKMSFTKISSEMALQALSNRQADALEKANCASADMESGQIDLAKKITVKACRKYLITGNFKDSIMMNPVYYIKKGDDLKITSDKVKVKAVTADTAKGLFLELAYADESEKICEFNSYEMELCKQDATSFGTKITYKTTTPKLVFFDSEDSADLQSSTEKKLVVKVGSEKTSEMTWEQSTKKVDAIANPKIVYSMSSMNKLVISFEMPVLPSDLEFDSYVAILKWEETGQGKFKNVYLSSNRGEFFDIEHNFKSGIKYSCKLAVVFKAVSERDKLILGDKSAEIVYEPSLNVIAGVVASVISPEKINIFPVPDMDVDESEKFALSKDITIQVEVLKVGMSDKFAELVQGPIEKELSPNFISLDVKLEKGQRYFVRMQLVDKKQNLAGRYLESNLITSDLDPQISEPKDVKTELVNNGDLLKVSWTKPDKGEPEEYTLFLQRDFQLYEPARNVTVAKDKTSFTFDDLRACSRYSVVVIPKNGVASLPKLADPTVPPKNFKSVRMFETKMVNVTTKSVRILFDGVRACPAVYTVEIFSLKSTSQKIDDSLKPKITFITSSKVIDLELECPGIYQTRVTGWMQLANGEKVQIGPDTSKALQLQAKANKNVIHMASMKAKLQTLNRKDETFHPDMGKVGSKMFNETRDRFCGLTNYIIENADSPLAARECKLVELKEGSVIADAQISFEQLDTSQTMKFTKESFQAVFDQGLRNMAPQDLAAQGFLIQVNDATIQTKNENTAHKKLAGIPSISLGLLAFALIRFF